MDDKDKSVIDKFKETVSEAVGNMGSTMTPSPKEKSKKVAPTTNEQVYIPEATDAAAMPVPLFATPARKRKTRATRAKKAAKKTKSAAGRKSAAKKGAAKKVVKKRKSKR